MRVTSRLALISGGALTFALSIALAVPLSQVQAATDNQGITVVEREQDAQAEATGPTATASTAGTEEPVLKSGIPVPQTEVRNKVAKHKDKLRGIKDARKVKFNAKKQKLCQSRKSKLGNSMQRSSKRSIKQAEMFDKMVPRLQAYMAKKNLNVADYQAILAEITAKKTDVEANLQTLQSVKAEFKCDGQTAGGTTAAYKDALGTSNMSIKEYRNSIKKLMKAVKAANAGQNSSLRQKGQKLAPVTETPAPAGTTGTGTEGQTTEGQ